MKILVVSMNSIHTNRWLEQLKDSHHEIYYFEALGGSYNKKLSWVKYQHYDWKNRMGRFKGRYYLKQKFPKLHHMFLKDSANEFKKVIDMVNPDVVHSFVFYISCVPFYKVIKERYKIKWIYSAWGNDLYFNQNDKHLKKDILNILPKVDFLFADCNRDIKLAKEIGFKGEVLGCFPTGGGYHLSDEFELYSVANRSGIIMKGYEGSKHRAINILKALKKINGFPLVKIFSADESVVEFVQANFEQYEYRFNIYDIDKNIAHKDLMNMFNSSLIYVSNNFSDGMPNTLLEAICNGAFPIQSNPGGASAEIITHGENGLLIEDCEDIEEIKRHISTALTTQNLIHKAFDKNLKVREKLEYYTIKNQVLEKYKIVENNLEC